MCLVVWSGEGRDESNVLVALDVEGGGRHIALVLRKLQRSGGNLKAYHSVFGARERERERARERERERERERAG